MQYAPTRVHEKPTRFHISPSGYTKNPSGFRPKPSSQDIWGHMQYAPTRIHEKTGGFHIFPSEYAKNAPDFTLPNKDTLKTCPISPFPIRMRPKLAQFYTQTFGEEHFGAYTIRPYTGTPKTRRVLDFATRHSAKPGGFWTLPRDIARNLAGFSHCHTT